MIRSKSGLKRRQDVIVTEVVGQLIVDNFFKDFRYGADNRNRSVVVWI